MDSLCFIFCLVDVIANDFGQLDVIGRCYYHVAFLSLQLVFCFWAGVIPVACFLYGRW